MKQLLICNFQITGSKSGNTITLPYDNYAESTSIIIEVNVAGEGGVSVSNLVLHGCVGEGRCMNYNTLYIIGFSESCEDVQNLGGKVCEE